ncbi:MAG: RusA family crossover junction endodeoxyribonuclease [Clostridia bacterium]|nr:RusA family crossover junction endodeoxyribonuclease [Clostridia bacterium]
MDESRIIQFSVPGEPRGKARPRVVNGHAYTPSGTVSYEAGVVLAYRNRYADRIRWEKGVPLKMKITACYPRPGTPSRNVRLRDKMQQPTRKPDADNIGKIVADALNGIAYYDDAQIVDLRVRKIYSDDPYVVVEIREMEDETD